MAFTSPSEVRVERTLDLRDLPERLCYGNVLRAFDQLEPGQRLILKDDLRPVWICELLIEARPNRAEIEEIQREEPGPRFRAVIRKLN